MLASNLLHFKKRLFFHGVLRCIAELDHLREVSKLVPHKPHRMCDLFHLDETQAALAFANKFQVNRRLEPRQLGKLTPRKCARPFTLFVKVLHVQAVILIFCYRFHVSD